jgi:succinoglycan biosynthesis transport protein ExoP
MPDQADNKDNKSPGEFRIRDQMPGQSTWSEGVSRPPKSERAAVLPRPVGPPPGGRVPIRKAGGADTFIQSVDFQKILKGLNQRKRLIMGITLACFALGLIGGLKAARVKYDSRSSLLYRSERQEQLLSSSGSTFTMKGMSRPTATSLIRRTSNMEQVVSNLNLSIRADELKWQVETKSEKNSQIVLLLVTGFPKKETAVRVANEVAAVAIADNAKFYRGQASSAAAQFHKQAESARLELAELNRKITDFQSSNRLIEPSADAKAFLDSITATAERLSNARIAYQSVLVRIQNYKQMIAGLASEVLRESFEDNPLKRRISNTEVALMEARTRYGADNPRVKQLEDEIKEMRRMIADKSFDQNREQVFQPNPVKTQFETELLKLEAERTVLQKNVEQLDGELKQIEQRYNYLPRQQLELSTLQQQRLAGEEMYKAMNKSEESAVMASQLDLADFEVLEPARDAVSNHSPLALGLPLLALIMGLVGSLVLAVLLEFMDPFLKTRKQAEGAYTVPLAPDIPRMAGLDTESAATLYLPVCRHVYDRWQRWKVESPCVTLGISSTVAGEGKSSLAYHVAKYCALLGFKTAILDFDAKDNSWLASSSFKAGLEVYLRDKAEWSDVTATVDGVTAMKVLNPTSDLLELMNSSAMARLLETVRSRFDLVIIEGPGVAEDESALFLAGFVDRDIFVIGSPVSSKAAVDAAFLRMEERHVRPSLLVLNMVASEYSSQNLSGMAGS